jgi:HK97 family phage portal protein
MQYTSFTVPKTKSTITVPAWVAALERSNGAVDEQGAYNSVPLIFRAVLLRSNAVAGAPYRIMKGESETDWPFETNLRQLIWKTEAALLLSGSAFWLKRANSMRVRDLQWLNPFHMTVQYDKSTGQLTFKQDLEGGKTYTQDQIVYFHEFNPTDDLTSGTSSTEVSLGNAKLMRYITDFAGEFFRNGAMPTTIVHVPTGTPESETKRVEKFFNRMVTGVKNAFRVIAVQGGRTGEGIDVQTVTHPIKDLAMPDLQDQALKNIAWAFGIPETMLTDAANYATAKEHRLSFWQDTVRPHADVWLAPTINEQLLAKMGLNFEFAYDEMDIFQEDESDRSDSFKNYVDAGMSPAIAAEILGIELPKGVDYAALDDYARETLTLRAQANANRNNDIINNNDGSNGKMADELRAWRKFALNRLGKESREFECKYIPKSLQGAIQGALEKAHTEDDINRIFEDVKRWERYP